MLSDKDEIGKEVTLRSLKLARAIQGLPLKLCKGIYVISRLIFGMVFVHPFSSTIEVKDESRARGKGQRGHNRIVFI